jgi:hypothetical protein
MGGDGMQEKPPVSIPQDVLNLLERIFRGCNADVAASLSRIPTLHETSLDQRLITFLGSTAPALSSNSGWIVGVETHFLGGGHHFDRWEIADIGVIIVLRRGRRILWSKAAILQSKRLFPNGSKFDARRMSAVSGGALADFTMNTSGSQSSGHITSRSDHGTNHLIYRALRLTE